MLQNTDYEKLAKDKGVYVVCEMDKDYNVYVKRLNPSNKTLNTYSVAKTFTAIAIGMCIDRGLIKLSDKFIEVMGINLKESCDQKWNNVTIEMLLKHQAGFERMTLDIDCDDVLSYGTKDYLEYVLSKPLPKQGVEAVYTDAAFYLLSRIVEKVSGKTLYEFLRPVLMDVMEYREYAWSSCPFGHTMGATGLYIRCEDMVKLGYLFLNDGVYKGTKVVSKEWCDAVLNNGYAMSNLGSGWYAKGGMLGQFLAVNKDKQIVVAWMGYSHNVNSFEMLGIN